MAHRECQEIGWNRLRHGERECPTAGHRPLAARGSRHHGCERFRYSDLGLVRHPRAWRVLQRRESARVNRLTLAEEEWITLAGGLRRAEPLQRQRLWRCAVGNRHCAGPGGELKLELPAKDGLVIAERIGNVAVCGRLYRGDC